MTWDKVRGVMGFYYDETLAYVSHGNTTRNDQTLNFAIRDLHPGNPSYSFSPYTHTLFVYDVGGAPILSIRSFSDMLARGIKVV